MKNPFLNIPYYPEFDKMTPEFAEAAFRRLIPETIQKVDEIENNFEPTWDGLILRLHQACEPLSMAWGLFEHLKSVVDNDGWRKIEDQFLPQMITFSQKVSQSKKFYQGYKAIEKQDQEKSVLDSVRRRILKQAISGMEQSGVGLPDEERKTLNEREIKISQCSMLFSNHLLDATKAFSLLLKMPEEVDGLPESLLAATAVAEEGKKPDPKKGPWKITLAAAIYFPFMKHSKNRAAREELYRAYMTRASSGEIDNRPLIEEIIKLRGEYARQLGYATYADLNLSTKMAKTVPAVDHLLRELADASLPTAAKEREERDAFARQHGFAGEKLELWDTAFWSERQREALYQYSEEDLKKYFPFPSVLKGLFGLAERLFGIKIQEADGEVPVWHPDVRFFRVNDENGAPIASFYLDPYSRPATKQGGAWMNSFRNRERKPDGSVVLPIAVLVCNQSLPIGGQPSLMRFDEVSTIFHEFGHSLQHMLTTVDYPEASGVSGIEWDAVEIASQFMENWCYDHATLQSLAHHVETGETLPESFYQKIKAAKNYMAANAMIRQLYFAMTDMDLYARYQKHPEWKNADDVQEKNRKVLRLPENIPEDHFLCSFSHIFAGGYAAGYYSYKWSEVISADLFAAFEEVGLDDGEKIRETGRRYRDTILSLGGGTDPAEVFRMFRGRDPSIDAILRHAGLK